MKTRGVPMNNTFASRMRHIRSSAIRELLKLTERPDIISFAGGLPAPELFPVEDMKTAAIDVLNGDGPASLQYSTTEGFLPLRKEIVKRMAKIGAHVSPDEVLVVSGSQQALDFCGKVFLDPGDVVIVERPSYLGAINAFRAYEARFVDIPMDDDGMIVEELELALKRNPRAKLIYTIPDFQNPTGRTLAATRRKRVVELAAEYGVHVIEDNPYGELRFEGAIPAPLKSLEIDHNVIYLGSFSKIFCPGFRLGWISAHPDLLQKFVFVKQSADLQSSTFSQKVTARYFEMFDIEKHISRIVTTYRRRRDLMLGEIEKQFPSCIKVTRSQGGLFTWAELPQHVDTQQLLQESVKRQVAFVPGGPFFVDPGFDNTMRLNYSNSTDEQIVEGIRRLGQVLRGI